MIHPRRLFCVSSQETQTGEDRALQNDIKRLVQTVNDIMAGAPLSHKRGPCQCPQLEPLRAAIEDLWRNRQTVPSIAPSPAATAVGEREDDGSLQTDIERLRAIRKECRNLFAPCEAPKPLSPTPVSMRALRRYDVEPLLFTPRSQTASDEPTVPRLPFSPRCESPWLDRLERVPAEENGRARAPVRAENIAKWLRNKVSLESVSRDLQRRRC
jgi:hypothetical protein